MSEHLLSILLPLCLFCHTSNASEVTINESNGHTYFHMAHTLEQDDFTLVHPVEYYDPKYPNITGQCKFENNGYFNIYILKSSFPVTAPSCNSEWLKVTMKGGDQAGLQSKRKLWDQLQALQSGELDEAKIIIELNPYISVVNMEPLELELQYCNIWFRSAYGHYISHLASISK